ncbi:MAG: amidophosphoribosyltransferase [Halofilum sp. (in: g-proteobacteria)]|nr:amidophosphoribosyltransferase [Halofilum sp. (in: g-proteobacteria)]
MCGIVGIVGRGPVNQALYDGLTLLQHRGQDASGIVTCHDNRLFMRKAIGLVRDVFHTRHMMRLQGNMGIGQCRYPTAGTQSSAEAQPFYVNSPYGIALAHNGNLTNAGELKRQLFEADLRHINTSSDSEVLLNVFAHELQKRVSSTQLEPEDVFQAVRRVHERARGAYAVIAMIAGRGILAFRDPYGIRPVVLGRRDTVMGPEYMIASESVALDALGFELVRDLRPGEAVYIESDGTMHSQVCVDDPRQAPCLFEFVYFARPDSIMDDVSVYKSRLRMGQHLADKVQREWPEHDIDVIIPIPDTSRTAALEMANRLGVKYREGFIKNRYIGRTFIMPGQQQRRKSVRQKLNAIELEFRGKNVLLVDDSIVRGTTSEQIIQMARDAGAKKVYMASAAPPVRYPNVYGIDMPAAEELIAHDRSEDEICTAIGADWLIYQSIEDLVEAVRAGNTALTEFEGCCFTGEYITGDVNRQYLRQLELLRGEQARAPGGAADGDGDGEGELEDVGIG